MATKNEEILRKPDWLKIKQHEQKLYWPQEDDA